MVAAQVAVEVQVATGKLSRQDREAVVSAIQKAESQTSGEIRVHLSYASSEKDALAAAKEHFDSLGMHQTQERNAVLLYLNLKLRQFALFGDQGIHKKVGQDFWNQLTTEISALIQNQNLVAGIAHAIEKIGEALQQHFPRRSNDRNELSNEVSEN